MASFQRIVQRGLQIITRDSLYFFLFVGVILLILFEFEIVGKNIHPIEFLIEHSTYTNKTVVAPKLHEHLKYLKGISNKLIIFGLFLLPLLIRLDYGVLIANLSITTLFVYGVHGYNNQSILFALIISFGEIYFLLLGPNSAKQKAITIVAVVAILYLTKHLYPPKDVSKTSTSQKGESDGQNVG